MILDIIKETYAQLRIAYFTYIVLTLHDSIIFPILGQEHEVKHRSTRANRGYTLI